MKPVHVVGLGLWTPGHAGVESWRSGAADPELTKPACDVVAPRQRRATSLATRMGLEVMGQAVNNAGVDRSEVKLVFGSAYGEFRTAVIQLEMLESKDGRLSPSRFKNSVHNTVTGLLSIAFGNHGFGTALAGGPATFAMSLLEGLALLDQASGGSVVVGVADETPADPFFEAPGHDFEPLGVALCLATDVVNGSSLARLSGFGRRSPAPPPARLPAPLAANPAAAALPLLEAILEGAAGPIPLETAVAAPYCIELHPGSGAAGQ